jgi:hypothetical protein
MKNIKVFLLSLIALVCIVLAFLIDWLFLIPAVIIMLINQRILLSKKPKKA